MLGSLFAAGYGPDALERYTWDQLGLMAECVALHRQEMLSAFLGPVGSALGVKYKPGRVDRGSRRPKAPTSVDYTDQASVKRAKARDARILTMASGIRGVKIEL